MAPVLDAQALEDSPLADLYLLANELGIDGYRRLRKADLVAAIIAKQGGEAAIPAAPAEAGGAPADEAGEGEGEGDGGDADAAEEDSGGEPSAEGDDEPARRRRSRRGGRGRRSREEADEESAPEADAEPAGEESGAVADGIVELLPNGSGFLRVPGDENAGDVYISAAQVKRCELVAGDRVTGPLRKPRNSERYPSLVRVDTINGRPADEVAEGTRFEDRPCAFPSERLTLGVEDPTVRAIEWLTPFGRGSRVVITGPARAGKTEALRRVAGALAAQGGVELIVVLAGARPEEIGEWNTNGLPAPAAVAALGASPEVQAQAVEQAVEQGRRVAARGGHAVLVIDSLTQLPVTAARRTLATARNLVDGGSLTVLATSAEPLGGETTVVTLDGTLTALGRFPALDLAASGTMRAELLVGDEGAEAITRARTEALA
ncbi:MAG: Transcription termination factor Rho [uncultured Solirubrobacteraceae bacterium]|uniref:Transcription termination factor Rho n=1 Tax=uncultured Solirubrobacteraceae bacterium TaxID=1162706 RepID=A0A6J4RFD4_9ACTN|nr:MAG: Transcription termination factor Rho [uncultured Solirubrobacteraceae bacterium]